MKVLRLLAFLLVSVAAIGCSRTATWERMQFSGSGGSGTLGGSDYQEHFYHVIPPKGGCPTGVTVFTQAGQVTVVVDPTLDPEVDWWGRLTAYGISTEQIEKRDCRVDVWYHAERVTLFLASEERAAEWKKNSGPFDPATALKLIEEFESRR